MNQSCVSVSSDRDNVLSKEIERKFIEKRSIFLWGGVEDASAKEVVQQLLFLEMQAPGEPITFYINSPGGVVSSGMAIYDVMQAVTAPVTTICMGMAASMGAILLSAGAKGKRYILPGAEVMIHQPALGGVFQGNAADISIQAEQIRKTKEIGARILAENCDKSIAQIMKDFNRDYWMNAEEAVRYGIVDSVCAAL